MTLTIDNNDYFFQEQQKAYCCDKSHINNDNGYSVCTSCGTTISQVFDESPRRIYNQRDASERKINEPVYFKLGYRTVIKGNRDASGNYMPSDISRKFDRLAKIQRSFITSYEQNLHSIYPIYEILKQKLRIPYKIAREALNIYEQSIKKKLAIGRNRIYIMAASVYCALRSNGTYHFIEEITEALDLNRKKLIKNCWLINKEVLPGLGMKIQHYTPYKYIERFHIDLKLSMKCGKRAINLLKFAEKNGYISTGKDPKGVAAGVLYLTSKLCGYKRTIKQISEVTRMNHLTIMKRNQELKRFTFLTLNYKVETFWTELDSIVN